MTKNKEIFKEIFDVVFDVIMLAATVLNLLCGAIFLYCGNRIEADLCFITALAMVIIMDTNQIRKDIKEQKENSKKTLEMIRSEDNRNC